MKKYIEPTIEVINIETQQMLASSGQQTLGFGENVADPSVAQGRRGFADEDEEEEW